MYGYVFFFLGASGKVYLVEQTGKNANKRTKYVMKEIDVIWADLAVLFFFSIPIDYFTISCNAYSHVYIYIYIVYTYVDLSLVSKLLRNFIS